MKKSLLALAVLGALIGEASAQTNVTIYGVADAGFVRESGGGAASVNKLTSGVKNGSRLGFKGSEDLGSGLSAKFQIEQGILLDTGMSGQGGATFGRQSWVGLAGGFGQVSLGRQYTPLFGALNEVDPFGTGLAGQANDLMSTGGTRMNNAVIWSSPFMSGLTASLAYGFGEQAGANSALRQFGAAAKYDMGPLYFGAAYHDAKNPVATGGSAQTALVYGSYNFGMARVYLGYAVNETDNAVGVKTVDSDDAIIGLSSTFGQTTLLASYINKSDDLGGNDARKWGIGAVYDLSKRTKLYASYGSINNDGIAGYVVGNATDTGTGTKAFNFGFQNWF